MRNLRRLIPRNAHVSRFSEEHRPVACSCQQPCRQHSRDPNSQTAQDFPISASCRDMQAGSLRSPEALRPCFLVVCVVVVVAGAIASLWLLPIPADLQTPPLGTLTLLDCRGREVAELASPEARSQFPVGLEQMGPWLPRVTVALEDRRFYDHRGIDWRASIAACARNLRSQRIVSGASTITQQLVKLAAGRKQRSWCGKLYETMVAWKLERRWSKERILSEYLNRSSYGNRRIGPEAAARAYFEKPARDLTLSEAIFLAGLPQAPTRFNPWRHPEEAKCKYERSLRRLTDLGVITRDQQSLLVEPPKIVRSDPPRLAPHFVDAVVGRNPRLGGTVRTTIDLDLQPTIERLVRSHLSALNRHDITQAAVVVVENATGAIRAMVGSENYAVSQINGAMQPRSCGSTLKPFVYLDAIDKRLFTAASLLPDTPDAIRNEYADYDPQNYSHHYFGPVRLREALGCSLNVPAVFVLSQLGARPTFYQLQKWGFNFPQGLDDYGAVWAGNFDGHPMRDTFAVRAATPLWAAIMQELLRRDHPLDAPVENARLVRREICKMTGLLPSRFSNATTQELFLAGTEPHDNSADYFANDRKLILPDAYARWCASRDNAIGAHVRSEFRITSPPPNAQYQIDPILPPSQQMIELTAACSNDVEWFVIVVRIALESDGRVFWRLASRAAKWR